MRILSSAMKSWAGQIWIGEFPDEDYVHAQAFLVSWTVHQIWIESSCPFLVNGQAFRNKFSISTRSLTSVAVIVPMQSIITMPLVQVVAWGITRSLPLSYVWRVWPARLAQYCGNFIQVACWTTPILAQIRSSFGSLTYAHIWQVWLSFVTFGCSWTKILIFEPKINSFSLIFSFWVVDMYEDNPDSSRLSYHLLNKLAFPRCCCVHIFFPCRNVLITMPCKTTPLQCSLTYTYS